MFPHPNVSTVGDVVVVDGKGYRYAGDSVWDLLPKYIVNIDGQSPATNPVEVTEVTVDDKPSTNLSFSISKLLKLSSI